ncbi:hypothetical protein [Flindersiella endophytica]
MPPAPVKPGLLAPKAEKQLFKALVEKPDWTRLSNIASEHPDWTPLCATLEGLYAYQARDLARAEPALTAAVKSGHDVSSHPFVQKYISASTVTLEVADGVQMALPIGREAAGLTLAELLQGTERLDQAIDVVEQLEPTFSAAVSLAELYSEAGRHDEVIGMTNGLSNETDAHAFLLVLRARALRMGGMFDAARRLSRRRFAAALWMPRSAVGLTLSEPIPTSRRTAERRHGKISNASWPRTRTTQA